MFLLIGAVNAFADEETDEDTSEQPPESTVIYMCSNEDVIIPVKSEEYGEDIINSVAKKLVPNNSKLKSYSIKETISYANLSAPLTRSSVQTVTTKKAAIDALYKLIRSKDSPITITVKSERIKVRKTPVRVKFKYTSKLYPFEFKVKTKGTKGKVTSKYQITSVNGKVTKTVKKSQKTKNGKYRVIYTGRKKTPKNLTVKKYKSYKAKVEKNALKTFGDVFTGKKIVNYGMKFLGNPYKVGGMSLTHGIDCVGFVRVLYQKYGIKLPGNRHKLFHVGRTVSYSKARAGDIVFYGEHPAIYMGNGKVIRAGKKGICINNINYKKYTYIRRVK